MSKSALRFVILACIGVLAYQSASSKHVFDPKRLTPVLQRWNYQDDDFLKYSSLYSWLHQENPDLELTLQILKTSTAARNFITKSLSSDDQQEFTRGRSSLAFLMGYADLEIEQFKSLKISKFSCLEFYGNMSKTSKRIDFLEVQCLIGNQHYIIAINGDHSLLPQVLDRELIKSVVNKIEENGGI